MIFGTSLSYIVRNSKLIVIALMSHTLYIPHNRKAEAIQPSCLTARSNISGTYYRLAIKLREKIFKENKHVLYYGSIFLDSE